MSEVALTLLLMSPAFVLVGILFYYAIVYDWNKATRERIERDKGKTLAQRFEDYYH